MYSPSLYVFRHCCIVELAVPRLFLMGRLSDRKVSVRMPVTGWEQLYAHKV